MHRGSIPSICLVFAVTAMFGGCKLEKNDFAAGEGDQKIVSSQPDGDMTALVNEIWDEQVVPHLQQKSIDMEALTAAIANDLDGAGETQGYRPTSEGSPWNFAAKVSGTILSAKTDTRAATADVDVTGDGKTDVTLQLGPVIRGTALRDILPFIDFSSFTDQIEFARLSGALNKRAFETSLKGLNRDALSGRQVVAVVAFTARGDGPPFLATPISVEVTEK